MSRKSIKEIEPDAYKAMLGLEEYIRSTTLDRKICEIIKIRVSQINGCAYCIDMHTQEAQKMGEDVRRLFAIAAWRESPLFSEQERAALLLAEEVTYMDEDGVSDEAYNHALEQFGGNGVAQIIMQSIIINSWNRIAVSTHQVFGE